MAIFSDTGHGGNKELIGLVSEQGVDYVRDNYIYSILESCDATVDDQAIVDRESWWRQMLLTRKFGYGRN